MGYKPTPTTWDWDGLLLEALKCGIPVAEFWELTPRELSATLEATTWRREQERKRDVALAWHVVALDRTKKLPSLKRLIDPPKAKKLAPEEAEQRKAEFEAMKARFGAGAKPVTGATSGG